MKAKTFAILLVAAGLLAALALVRTGKDTGTTGPKMGEKLLADLPVNQVAEVAIADAENHTTLVKGESTWQVQERSGFPADFDQLRDTVVKLSRLKIGRSFPGDPDSLARLSLLPPSDPNASAGGTRITLKDASGKTLADLVLGQVRSKEDGSSGGQYLKKIDADAVYLVDASFRFLKTAPTEWLQKEILNIKADAVESVTCYADEGQKPVYTLARSEKGKDAQLTPIPKGRSADANRIDQVIEALAPLTVDDVQPADGPAAIASDLPKLVYHLFDGREIDICPATAGEESYTLRIAARETAMEETPSAVESTPEADESKEQKEEKAEKVQEPTPRSAKEINDALGPWVFSIKKWQYDSFVTKPESLLEEVKKEE
ncbi:hypothetical protein DSCW_62920 [Desulfosarcina widdelii]|uniref:DUF4340 domain-containing protein n=1 Tax=Desulfosarcina widdelii TaxID=947919 RepID=A0A5K7ZDN3_9BACT|nr:DUF4340 domain-containing protein [Desulfosarcina widdelii]BBO78875.1 hypothetical protein DSCW_62920 [Desulfosarcina widdelii]